MIPFSLKVILGFARMLRRLAAYTVALMAANHGAAPSACIRRKADTKKQNQNLRFVTPNLVIVQKHEARRIAGGNGRASRVKLAFVTGLLRWCAGCVDVGLHHLSDG